MRRRLFVLAALAFVTRWPSTAHAGRTQFTWLYDTETLPERGVELVQWLLEENGKGDAKENETLVWWGPIVGVTDQLELALPVEISFGQEGDGPGATNIERFGAEARWRLVTSDPDDAPAVVPLVRLGAKRVVNERGYYRIEPGATVSAQLGSRLRFVVDATAIVKLRPDSTKVELRPGAGFLVSIFDDVQIGAEVFSEIGIDDPDTTDWVAVGPDLAWTHGRFWLSAGFPIGVVGIESAPRMNWGIAF